MASCIVYNDHFDTICFLKNLAKMEVSNYYFPGEGVSDSLDPALHGLVSLTHSSRS